jgi:hypothetical protein
VKPAGQQQERGAQRPRDADDAARDRTPALALVQAVAVEVVEVVQQVRRRRDQRERGEGGKRVQHARQRIVESEQQRHEHQHVLEPLVHADGADPRHGVGARAGELGLDVQTLGQRAPYGPRDADQHRGVCGLPDRHVGTAVAGIAEVLSDALADGVQLRLAFQVALAVAGQHVVEKVVLPDHRHGDALVRGGRQHNAPLGGLRLQEVQQVVVQRQRRHLPSASGIHAFLEGGTARDRPPRQLQQRRRSPLDETDDALPQRVGQCEGTVEIHHQRRGGSRLAA